MSGQVAVKAYKLPTERLHSLCTLSTSLIMTRYYEDYNMDLPAIGAKRCDKHINTTYNVNTADTLPCYGKKGGEKVGHTRKNWVNGPLTTRMVRHCIGTL